MVKLTSLGMLYLGWNLLKGTLPDLPLSSGYNLSGTESATLNRESILKTRTANYRSLRALRARNPQKVSKRSPGPPGPECPNSLEKSQKVSKKCQQETFPTLFLRLFDSFRDFLDTPGREARGDLFETFWGFRARRARRLL